MRPNQRFFLNKISFLLAAATCWSLSTPAQAMNIDWSGYFRADHNYVQNYQIDAASPGYSNNPAASGEYIKGEGQKSTTFSSVFMKLKPKILVNDNVIIHSEWNVGDPIYGLFGRGVPDYDRNNPLSTSKDAFPLSVARIWLDTHTDFGTLQVGRAPMHWGLGAIFNSGDGVMDRYQSTSDTIRLLSKFGYLTLMPLYAKNAMGSHLAGADNPTVSPDSITEGSDDVTDYGLALKYENPEEDLDAGVIYYKRNASDTQTSYYYPASPTQFAPGPNGMNLKLIDIYVKKTWNHLELKGEIPFYSGTIGDVNGAGSRNEYKAASFIGEVNLNYDTWKHSVKFGTVPGQGNETTGARDNNFGAMNLNRDYKLGLILFNYNLHNFGFGNPDPVPGSATGNAPASAVSPYDASITNAKYLMFATEKHWEQWGVSGGLIFARSNEAAQAGKDYYNQNTHSWGTAVSNQANNMGAEIDLGTHYNWDDNISFGLEGGIFLPGAFYSFINIAGQSGNTNSVKAVSLTATTVF